MCLNFGDVAIASESSRVTKIKESLITDRTGQLMNMIAIVSIDETNAHRRRRLSKKRTSGCQVIAITREHRSVTLCG